MYDLHLNYNINIYSIPSGRLILNNHFTKSIKLFIIDVRDEKEITMKTTKHHDLMAMAVARAKETMNQDKGGPFGALIIDKNQNILAVASNTVLGDHDPTAHAEINAIRQATKELGTHDLSGCTLYTTCYPCPMCLGAIIWSNIKKVYYGCSAKDADEIGFRDDFIYEFIKNNATDKKILDLEQEDRKTCLTIFEEYHKNAKQIY